MSRMISGRRLKPRLKAAEGCHKSTAFAGQDENLLSSEPAKAGFVSRRDSRRGF